MIAGFSDTGLSHFEDHDFLFTWKHKNDYNPRKYVTDFKSKGIAKVWWICRSYRRIQCGDRAYLLKQGNPIGIFGRGSIIDKDEKSIRGKSAFVRIRFEVSRGDVLCNPADEFLVDEEHLPTPKSQWQIRPSGMPLKSRSARQLDNIIGSIPDSMLLATNEVTLPDEVARDIERRIILSKHSTRPDQQRFSKTIRKIYRNKCAVTPCVTHEALEAAHISTQKGEDNNKQSNGILLRSDIHALFDRFLVTLSKDGTFLEISAELTDPGYTYLKKVTVARPDRGAPPSTESIGQHRKLFLKRRRWYSAKEYNRLVHEAKS